MSINLQQYDQMLRVGTLPFLEVEVLEELIDAYSDKGELSKALEVSEIGLSQHPFSVELLHAKAKVLFLSQEVDKSLQLVDKALGYNPDNRELLFLKADLFLKKYDESKAVPFLEEVSKIGSDLKEEAFHKISLIWINIQEFKKAQPYLYFLFSNAFESEEYFFDLMLCYEAIDEVENFVSLIEKQIDEEPYNAVLWNYKGILHSSLDEFDEALNAFDYATIINPSFASAYFNWGNILKVVNRPNEAIEAFNKTIELEGGSEEVYCGLGACYSLIEDFKQAYQNFKKATELNDKFEDAWYGMAIALSHQERFFEAIHFIEKAIKLSPEIGDYWLLLAELENELGNEMSAFDAFERASELEPDTKAVWLNWSIACFDKQMFDNAIEIIQNGLEELPDDPELLYRLCAYELATGNYQDAIQHLEEALVVDFDGHKVLFDFFPNLETQKVLYKIIQHFK